MLVFDDTDKAVFESVTARLQRVVDQLAQIERDVIELGQRFQLDLVGTNDNNSQPQPIMTEEDKAYLDSLYQKIDEDKWSADWLYDIHYPSNGVK